AGTSLEQLNSSAAAQQTQLITISADSLSNLIPSLSGNMLGLVSANGTGSTTSTSIATASGLTGAAITANSALTTSTANGLSTSTTGQSSEQDRPFKCELCNSTFTRLGNY